MTIVRLERTYFIKDFENLKVTVEHEFKANMDSKETNSQFMLAELEIETAWYNYLVMRQTIRDTVTTGKISDILNRLDELKKEITG